MATLMVAGGIAVALAGRTMRPKAGRPLVILGGAIVPVGLVLVLFRGLN
jgi:hypothetical protein